MTHDEGVDANERGELSYEGFFQRVLELQPSFQSAYDAHIEQYGELLPFVLMADYARFLFGTCREACVGFELLEAAIKSHDESLTEMVSVSFLENLDQAGDVLDVVSRLLGPSLSAELERIERADSTD